MAPKAAGGSRLGVWKALPCHYRASQSSPCAYAPFPVCSQPAYPTHNAGFNIISDTGNHSSFRILDKFQRLISTVARRIGLSLYHGWLCSHTLAPQYRRWKDFGHQGTCQRGGCYSNSLKNYTTTLDVACGDGRSSLEYLQSQGAWAYDLFFP